jgi:D-sedoheptulose 7-phosphate isomerase
MDVASMIERQRAELAGVVEATREAVPRVAAMASAVVQTLRSGGTLLTAGNGGSAADALHMAEELTGRYRQNRRPLPAICLAADTTALTCIGNDFGFDHVFSRQVEALGRPGDLLVIFSTSGNSPNLLLAWEAAQKKDLLTLGLLGKDGGKLAGKCTHEWIVPHSQSARIQELHTWVMHCILELVEAEFAE